MQILELQHAFLRWDAVWFRDGRWGLVLTRCHARGPVGLEGLMIHEYRLAGSGQGAAMYGGRGREGVPAPEASIVVREQLVENESGERLGLWSPALVQANQMVSTFAFSG